MEDVLESAVGTHFSGLCLDSRCLSSSVPSSPSSTTYNGTADASAVAASRPASPIARLPFVIGVPGGTASGKTRVCDMIIQQQHDHRVVLVNQDSFYHGLPEYQMHLIQSDFWSACED